MYETEPNFNLSPGVNPQRFPGTSAGRDAAGIAASRQALGPTSQLDPNGPCPKGCKYEYGGLILKDKSGRYAFTDPVTFKQGSHFWPDHVMVPFGYRRAGSYHTHPGARNDPKGDGMSDQDATQATVSGMPGYMGEEMTGKVWKFDPNTMSPCQTADHCGLPIFPLQK